MLRAPAEHRRLADSSLLCRPAYVRASHTSPEFRHIPTLPGEREVGSQAFKASKTISVSTARRVTKIFQKHTIATSMANYVKPKESSSFPLSPTLPLPHAVCAQEHWAVMSESHVVIKNYQLTRAVRQYWYHKQKEHRGTHGDGNREVSRVPQTGQLESTAWMAGCQISPWGLTLCKRHTPSIPSLPLPWFTDPTPQNICSSMSLPDEGSITDQGARRRKPCLPTALPCRSSTPCCKRGARRGAGCWEGFCLELQQVPAQSNLPTLRSAELRTDQSRALSKQEPCPWTRGNKGIQGKMAYFGTYLFPLEIKIHRGLVSCNQLLEILTIK